MSNTRSNHIEAKLKAIAELTRSSADIVNKNPMTRPGRVFAITSTVMAASALLVMAQPANSPTEPALAAPAPITKAITDAKGRSTDGTIMGRKGNNLLFRRASDGKEFTISVETLSGPDREFIATLPEGVYSHAAGGEKKAAETPAKPKAAENQPEGNKAGVTIDNDKMLLLGIPLEKPEKSSEVNAATMLAALKFMEADLKMNSAEMEMLFPKERDAKIRDTIPMIAESFGYYSDTIFFSDEATAKATAKKWEAEGGTTDPEQIKLEKLMEYLKLGAPIVSIEKDGKLQLTVGFNKEAKSFIVWDMGKKTKPRIPEYKEGMAELNVDKFKKAFSDHIVILQNRANPVQATLALPGGATPPKGGKVAVLGKAAAQDGKLESYLNQAMEIRFVIEHRRGNGILIQNPKGELIEVKPTHQNAIEVGEKPKGGFILVLPADEKNPNGPYSTAMPVYQLTKMVEANSGLFVITKKASAIEKMLE